MGEDANRVKEQITRVLETNEKKMTRTYKEMFKTVFAESKNIIRKGLSNIITAVQDEEKWSSKFCWLA